MQQLNVQQYLDNRPLSGKQWLVFVLGVLIILAEGLDSGAIGFIAPSLLSAWGIDKPALAPVVSASLVGMAIGALVAGPLADRFGRKWVVIASCLRFCQQHHRIGHISIHHGLRLGCSNAQYCHFGG